VRGARVVVDRARQPSFVERVRIWIRENRTRGEARLLTRAAAADLAAAGKVGGGGGWESCGGGCGASVGGVGFWWVRTACGVAFCTLYTARGACIVSVESSRAAVEAVPFPLAATAGIDDPC